MVSETGDNGCEWLLAAGALQLLVQLKSEPLRVAFHPTKRPVPLTFEQNGDCAKALDQYQQMLVIKKRLAKYNPANSIAQRELSITYVSVTCTSSSVALRTPSRNFKTG